MTGAANYALRQRRDDIAEKIAISNRICTQIDRGQDLLKRLSATYRPEDKLSDDVKDYLIEYESIRSMFSTESLGIVPSMEGVFETVAAIVRNLWALLCKLWDNIRHCFHYIFSAQYRAQSNLINYRKKIAIAGSTIDDKFKRYEVDAGITKNEYDQLITSTNKIVDMLEGIPQQTTIEGLDKYVAKASIEAGIVFEDNHFVDHVGDIPYKCGTYGSLGWSIKDALDLSAKAVTCVGRQVKLKRIASTLEKEISEIKREINNKVEKGATSDTLAGVEAKLAFKTKMFRLLQAGLLALSGRLTQIDILTSDIAEDADDIANGRVGDAD